MVNEILANMLLDSCKEDSIDRHPDTKHLYWMLRQAPVGIDFPLSAKKIEGLAFMATLAKDHIGNSIDAQILQDGIMRLYNMNRYAIDAMSSEGGRMIKTMQTQVSEHTAFGNIQPTQKQTGMQGFFKQMGQKKVF